MGKEGKEPFLGLTSSLSLSLLFGSLDLRGLEVPKSSKGGWSRVKARASACCESEGEAAATCEESEMQWKGRQPECDVSIHSKQTVHRGELQLLSGFWTEHSMDACWCWRLACGLDFTLALFPLSLHLHFLALFVLQ